MLFIRKYALTSFLAAALLLSSCAVGYRVDEPVLVSGGLSLNNLLYTPSVLVPGARYPGVVVNHGGTKGVERQAKAMAGRLAKRGYVVVLPQFRGQGGSEGYFSFAGGEVEDSLAALEYLKGLDFVDAGRIGMVGHGLGGLVTLRALQRTDSVRAAVLMAAISDPAAYFSGGALKDKPASLGFHVRKVEDRSVWPGVGSIGAPVLILHGGKDKKVAPEQSIKLYGELRAAGKDAAFVIYPDAGHDLMYKSKAIQDAFSFLDERLMDEGR